MVAATHRTFLGMLLLLAAGGFAAGARADDAPGQDKPPAPGQDKPLWEFGLGLGAVIFEDYRGSDTAHARSTFELKDHKRLGNAVLEMNQCHRAV